MFTFKKYWYSPKTCSAHFQFSNNNIEFEEVVKFSRVDSDINKPVLDATLKLVHLLIGTSYYKTFPTKTVRLDCGAIDDWQANFLNSVYQDGLSQFAFENNLGRQDLASFSGKKGFADAALKYSPKDSCPLVLQSGGKDSLLLASLLQAERADFTPFYISSNQQHPSVLDSFTQPLVTVERVIDHTGLNRAKAMGALNGHVPVTYIVLVIALLQAVLLNKGSVLSAIGHEGEEPHLVVGDLAVLHQWAKTWQAEQALSAYVHKYISPVIQIGSPLRGCSELKIAKLFVENAWSQYGRDFSSCNISNYKQKQSNQMLKWCGECPKCANSFLLFAPFVEHKELAALFGGKNLFTEDSLVETFKGLLGIDNVMKPLECVGEVEELRLAYHMAQLKHVDYILPFYVPESNFDIEARYPGQLLVTGLV